MSNNSVGQLGENIACGYLVNKGYQIIARNYWEKFGEIDIIAKSPDKTLVFIEVKTITNPNLSVDKSPASYPHLAGFKAHEISEGDDIFKPEDHMTQSKISKFRKICQWYANNHPELVGVKGYQLDVLAIEIDNDSCSIRHYKNV